jgi:mono/diheme cytochrome c family protein
MSEGNRRRNGTITSSSFIVALLASLCGPAVAQELGDIAAGQRLADNWCSSCHIVGANSQRGTSTGAPPFSAIARMKSTTPMALRAFLQTPHSRMPDLHLSREEIDNVTAYILSLRR